MPDYNFKNLSPYEFEELSRDLLQKYYKVFFESFANGKDRGIDFRYSINKTRNAVLQCKRYFNYNSLIQSLKLEVPKVKRLKPSRYILTISFPLTPGQKRAIFEMFSPFILEESEIFNGSDLNNLLGLHPDIEKQHFKLWLSSTNVLSRILHSKVHNISTFEKEEIQETVKLYVRNESYDKALAIVKEKKYVIISGLPGIGKTTLARILVYHYLANGFTEFVYLSDSIDDGYRLFSEGVRQVFLFDDFLGRNFLGQKLKTNEEQRIVKFIEKVNKSEDKILLLTTREYILTQAKNQYDVFDNPSIDVAKCVIDLSHYTKLVKAKILYNHLFFSGIKKEYVEKLLKDGNYRYILNHRNYNPRIIQAFTNLGISGSIAATDFMKKIKEFLDYPDSVWRHVFENQISSLSQIVLSNLVIAGTPILLEDLRNIIQTFAKAHSVKYNLSYSEIVFQKAIKELENTFILTQVDERGTIAVNYKNPSVQDFLVRYLSEYSDILKDIINSAAYFNQFFTVFTIKKDETVARNKIYLDGDLKEAWIDRLIKDFHYLNSSEIIQAFHQGRMTFYWYRRNFSDYSKLISITKMFAKEKNKRVVAFSKNIFGNALIPSSLNAFDFDEYIELVRAYEKEFTLDGRQIIKEVFGNITYLDQVLRFEKLKNIFPNEFEEFASTPDFSSQITDLIDSELIFR